jgi:hypothetical protein
VIENQRCQQQHQVRDRELERLHRQLRPLALLAVQLEQVRGHDQGLQLEGDRLHAEQALQARDPEQHRRRRDGLIRSLRFTSAKVSRLAMMSPSVEAK